jgi:hypothetical protein
MTKNLSKKLINIDEFNFPETLYKYRFWSDEHHKKIITNREVYYSSPNKFTDSNDCKIPKRWDLFTYEDLLNRFYLESLQWYDLTDLSNRVEYCISLSNMTLLENYDYVTKKEQEDFTINGERYGVLSLTDKNDSRKMWNKYGDSHKGFCIGFYAEPMLKEIISNVGNNSHGGGKVNYTNVLPNIHPYPKQSYEEQFILQIYSKLKKYKFEQEYRSYIGKDGILTDNERILKVNKSAYKEIIIGAKMSINDIRNLISSIPDELKRVPIKRTIFENQKIVIVDYISTFD